MKDQYSQGFNSKLSTKNNIARKDKNANVMQTIYSRLYPILPLKLTAKKPKSPKYPKQILTVGDEFKAKRLDKSLTQQQVAELLHVNRNFIYELELDKRNLTIFALQKVYLFLGYVPKALKIDERTLSDKLFVYRIKNGLTYSKLAEQIGLDKSTLIRVEKRKPIKQGTKLKIVEFFKTYFK